MHHGYTYQATLAASQRINWRIEDIIGGNKRLDFSRPFLPDQLARVEGLDFLSSAEKLALNQVRGNAYLYLFGLVEEFILPFILDHGRPQLHGDDYRVRAFLQFASEEAKHIHLFKRFSEEFEAGFGTPCGAIGPAIDISRVVLSHHPLAVALVILHIEWMTQRHYLDSVKDNANLDPQFASLLKHHWMEEAQHAKLDTLMVESLARSLKPAEIAGAIEEYLKIGAFLDAGLKQQTAFDLESLARATGRILNEAETETFMTVQHQANRWTYLGSGMTHPNFVRTLEFISPEASARVAEVAPAFS